MSKKIEQEKPRKEQGEDGTWLRTEGLLKILPVSRRTLDRWRAEPDSVRPGGSESPAVSPFRRGADVVAHDDPRGLTCRRPTKRGLTPPRANPQERPTDGNLPRGRREAQVLGGNNSG